MSPQQVALAWELALAPVVVPIPGASRPESIEDSVKAADLELSDDEVKRPLGCAHRLSQDGIRALLTVCERRGSARRPGAIPA